MPEHWQSLIANFSVVALFISAWLNGQFLFAGRPRLWRNVAFGVVMGGGAMASIALGFEFEPGIRFDLRAALIAVAAFFGGPGSAIIAAGLAIVFRLVVGGPGALAGVVSVAAAALTAYLVSRLTQGRVIALVGVALLAVSVALVNMGVTLGFRTLPADEMVAFSVPLAVMVAIATAVSGVFIMRQRVIERERDLLRAAFLQSPDLQYVKTPESRFAAVNIGLARASGFAHPEQMIGKSDFDILQAESAQALVEADRKIMASGKAMVDFEELVITPEGEEVWYLTSKVALSDPDGEIIGVAGVTRDVTARKRLERELVESRNQLAYVLAEISDGIAMFDRGGTLVYCNEQYRRLFGLTYEVRRSGQHMRDILREVVEKGEQKGVPSGDEEAWIDRVEASLKVDGEEEVSLYDGRWLHLRTRPTRDGAALVVVSDITKIKEAETALLALTGQLKQLATTDGLTGIMNRRAFDQALAAELARCRRENTQISLLMIDVDHFKAFNDRYGHPAGDQVLIAVAQALRGVLKRPGDLAARYGGEEFAAILPGTGEDGAFFIADDFREALHALALPHEANEKNIVTASVGIATFGERDTELDGTALVRRADEALYNAKAAGRDRVTGWRARYEVRAVGGMGWNRKPE